MTFHHHHHHIIIITIIKLYFFKKLQKPSRFSVLSVFYAEAMTDHSGMMYADIHDSITASFSRILWIFSEDAHYFPTHGTAAFQWMLKTSACCISRLLDVLSVELHGRLNWWDRVHAIAWTDVVYAKRDTSLLPALNKDLFTPESTAQNDLDWCTWFCDHLVLLFSSCRIIKLW
jgi:hypothetical protein